MLHLFINFIDSSGEACTNPNLPLNQEMFEHGVPGDSAKYFGRKSKHTSIFDLRYERLA